MIWQLDDGSTIDTSGEYRVLLRGDKHYVAGEGLLSRVANLEEGESFIRVLKGIDPLPGSPEAKGKL